MDEYHFEDYNECECYTSYDPNPPDSGMYLYLHVMGTGVFLEGKERISELRWFLNTLDLEETH